MTWGAVAAGVIGAGVGLYSANKQKQAAKDLQKKQQPLVDAQTKIATTLLPYASSFYKRAGEAYDPVAAHYKALAGGDRSQLLAAVAPELSTINSKYGSLISASRELNPRSGAGAAYNSDLAFRAGDEGQALIDKERSGAFDKLGSLAGEAGSIGGSAAGYGSNAAGGAGNLLLSQFNIGRQSAADQGKSYADIAKALEEAWNAYNSKSSGTSTTPFSGESNPWW